MAFSKENIQYGKASDFYEDISDVCEPCSIKGKRLQANRFCVECQEHLCQKCSTYHNTLKATRSHVLVTIDDAKKAKPVASKDKCSAKCTVHTGKSIKYLCVTHSYLGCSVCITIDHKQCKSIDYIPKVAKDIRNLDGFKKFDKNLKFLESSCKSSIADVEKNIKQLSEDERQMKEAVKELRKKINDALDTLENELTTQATKINHEETKILNALSNKLTTTLGNVDALLNQVATLLASGKNCDIYVMMKKDASHLVALNDKLVNTTKGKTFQRYEFQPNNELFKAGAFGKMSCRKENISPSSEKRVVSPCTDDSVKMTATVSKPCTDGPTASGRIQPGTRVRRTSYYKRFYGGSGGTAERYNSSDDTWLVKWDNGRTGWCCTWRLEITKK